MPIIRKQDGELEASPYSQLRLTNNPFLQDPSSGHARKIHVLMGRSSPMDAGAR